MGIYRSEFAAAKDFAFTEGSLRFWEQRVPYIGNTMLLGMNKTGQNVLVADGTASIELLEDDPRDLDTPLRVSYKFTDKIFDGFYFNHRTVTQRASVPEGFDEIVINEEPKTSVRLLNSGEELEYRFSQNAIETIIPFIGIQFCEKLIRLDNGSNPVLEKLKAEMLSA